MSVLTVENLSVAVADRTRALFGRRRVIVGSVSFEVPLGVTALVGDNGTGKSTILRAVMDPRAVTAGQVLIDGRPLRLGEVGYVPQSPASSLSPWRTVLAEATLALRVQGQGAVARRAALSALLAELHLFLPLDRRVDQLSGGQRVMVAIVRALLVMGARAFVLDEPFEGLSERARTTVTRLIARVAQRYPVLLTSHRADDLTQLNARLLRLTGSPVAELIPIERPAIKYAPVLAGPMGNEGPRPKAAESDSAEDAIVIGQDGSCLDGRDAFEGATRERAPGVGRKLARASLGGVVGLLIGFGLWWAAAAAVGHAGLIPRPATVLAAAGEIIADVELRRHLAATMARALASWALAMLIATPVGVVLGYYDVAYRLAAPWISVARCVPVFALAGTAIGLFPGMPDIQRVALITTTLALVAIQVVSAATFAAPRRRVELARLFGAGPWFRLRHVLLHEVWGGVMGALETTLPLAVIVTFVVETTLLPRFGLGQYVYNHMTDADLSVVWAFLLVPAVAVAVGVLLLRLSARAARREL